MPGVFLSTSKGVGYAIIVDRCDVPVDFVCSHGVELSPSDAQQLAEAIGRGHRSGRVAAYAWQLDEAREGTTAPRDATQRSAA